MYPHPLMLLLRRLGPLALVGAGFVLFSGAIFWALGLFIILALGGFVVWMPLHSVFFGPKWPLRRSWSKVPSLRQPLIWQSFHRVNPIAESLAQAENEVRTFLQRFTTFLIEGFSGALLGFLIALLGIQEFRPEPLAVGALAGTACGVLVALFHLRSSSTASSDVGY